MKNYRIFSATILIGFGTYFFLQQSNISLFPGFHSWPTLLIIVGISFLIQGYIIKEYEAILPGVILTGFGTHFHITNHFSIWPDHFGIFMLIIALAMLLRYQKLGTGLIQGLIFLVIALLMLFYDKLFSWFGLLENGVATIWKFWPFILIVYGLYLLLFKRR